MNNDLGCMGYPLLAMALAPLLLVIGFGIFKLAGLIIGVL